MAVFIHPILFKLSWAALHKNIINVIVSDRTLLQGLKYMTVLGILFNKTS